MDENTVEVLKITAKKTAIDLKDEIVSTWHTSGFVFALAFVGALYTFGTGLFLATLFYFLFTGYFNYQSIQDSILFDIHAAEYDRKAAEREAAKSEETTPEDK